MDLLEKARFIYNNFKQTTGDISLCENYVYGRGKDIDKRLVDITIQNNGKKYVKSRFQRCTDSFKIFFNNLLKKKFLILDDNRNTKLLTGKDKNQLITEKELIGTVLREDFLLNINIEKCTKVDFGKDVNLDVKNQRCIRIFENIPKESEFVIFYCYGLNDNFYSSYTMCDLYKYNDVQQKIASKNKPFGFLHFSYSGTCMSGNVQNEGDVSFVDDALLAFKYLVENFPNKKIIVSGECFGVNIVLRLLADLNLDCIARDEDFKNKYNITSALCCAPYISSLRLKQDQRFITKILLYAFSKNYRYGHRSKFSNIDVLDFIPSYINIIFLQARSNQFRNKDDFFLRFIPLKVKNLFTLRESDNLVSFKQTYQLANKIIQTKHNLFFYYSSNVDHDRITFLFWNERFDILNSIKNNVNYDSDNAIFSISDIKLIYLIRRTLIDISKISEQIEVGLFNEIKHLLDNLVILSIDKDRKILYHKLHNLISKLTKLEKDDNFKYLKLDLLKIKNLLEKNKKIDNKIKESILMIGHKKLTCK